METPYFARYAVTCAVIALLAGCGALQSPTGAPGAMPLTSVFAARADKARSWMLPEAKAENLLYVSNYRDNYVVVYDYKTGAAVGRLNGFDGPHGQCVDKNGNVWIVNYFGESIVEYSHGGTTPLKTLATDGMAWGCAVSAKGDLAVDNYYRAGTYSNMQIFKNASGTGQIYDNPTDCFVLLPPAYDDKGNLYIETAIYPSSTYVCELPANGTSLKKVTLSGGHITDADNAIWDGKHIALVDAGYNGDYDTATYQTKHLASGGLRLTGTTPLAHVCKGSGSHEVTFPFVVGKKNTPINDEQGNVVLGSVACQQYSVKFWHYPTGGRPFRTITLPKKFELGGQSVSLANHH
jgi:hypothetical protein